MEPLGYYADRQTPSPSAIVAFYFQITIPHPILFQSSPDLGIPNDIYDHAIRKLPLSRHAKPNAFSDKHFPEKASKIPNVRTVRSNFLLIAAIGNLKRILRNQESFHIVYQRKDPRQVDEVKQDPFHTLDQAFESLDREGPPHLPSAMNYWPWPQLPRRPSPTGPLPSSPNASPLGRARSKTRIRKMLP